MAYLISQLWLWLLLAFIIGCVVGWKTCSDEPTRWWTGWVPWGTLAFVVGLLLAIFRVFPDRAGYMLDAALLMFGSYIIGCCIAGLLRLRGAGVATPVAVAAAASGHGAAVARPVPAPAAPAAAPARVAEVPAKPVSAPAPAPAPVVAAPVAAAEPPPAPPVAGEADIPGRKPKTYAAPRGGKADDLKRIRGIGKQNEGRLHALGVWHFDQVAAWVKDEIEWVGSYLAFPGRIEREDWVSQAKSLAAGVETEFSRRVARGEVATSKDDGSKGQGNVVALKGVGDGKPKP